MADIKQHTELEELITRHRAAALPFSVTIIRPLASDGPIEQWANKHIGKRWQFYNDEDGLWHTEFAGWVGQDTKIKITWYFRNEKDANWFVLRWA